MLFISQTLILGMPLKELRLARGLISVALPLLTPHSCGLSVFSVQRALWFSLLLTLPWRRKRRSRGKSLGRDGGGAGEWRTIGPDPFNSQQGLGPNANQGDWAPGAQTYFLLPVYILVHRHIVGSAVSTLLYFQGLKGKLRKLYITSRVNNRNELPDFD